MDYQKFYAEVVKWINQANQIAFKHGIESESFWSWVTTSAAEMCRRYDDNPLVIKQMMMLSEWLEGAYEKKIGG